jgi:putative phosphoesterase
MRIGVISDTHGLLRPEVLDVFSDVDHIIHAGDIGGVAILDALRRIARVTFVEGNNDASDGCDVTFVDLDGLRILVTHILPRPSAPGSHVRGHLPSGPRRRDSGVPDVVIFGHSHLPHDEVIDGVRFFNPASAGPRRFDYPVAVGMIEDRVARHIALDERSLAALGKRMNQMR